MLYSRSVSAGGMGEQGVASGNVLDAMQYNPANLVYSDKFSFSFFNNPWNVIGFHFPLIALNSSLKFENGSSVGIDYTYWDFGRSFVSTDSDPDGINTKEVHFFERSVAAAYATPMGEHFAAGLQARYVWMPILTDTTIEHLLISAGVSGKPEIFSERIAVGFSLINFSTAVKVESNTDSPPAQMNVGAEGSVVTNHFFDVTLALGAMKPIVKQSGPPDHKGESSFSALLHSWSNFPNDVTAQVGLGFLWHPIDLGAGVSFLQEMYLGYFTVGPRDSPNSFMTHGTTVGVQAHGIKATAGYAGRWHNYRSESYWTWEFPWETVQFSLSGDMDIFGKKDEQKARERSFKNIILSAGYTQVVPVGKFKKSESQGFLISWSVKPQWTLESDFYFSDNSALHTSFGYSPFKESLKGDPSSQIGALFGPSFHIDFPTETVSLESGFRYHPLDAFHPLFVQASIGIIRMNPVPKTSPRYFYKTYDEFTFGFVVSAGNTGIVVVPKAGLKTIFMQEYSNANLLGGYNQFTLGVNLGYEM